MYKYNPKRRLLLLPLLQIWLCGWTGFWVPVVGTVPLPTFSLENSISKCKIDSPEEYYDEVARYSISAVQKEGKIFIPILMKRLKSSLPPNFFESLRKDWDFVYNVISEGVDVAAGRIHSSWQSTIGSCDVVKLPWEQRWEKIIVQEHLISLLTEYYILDSVLQNGINEIMASLTDYLDQVVATTMNERVGFDALVMSDDEMVRRWEKELKKSQPNFIGAMLRHSLRNIAKSGDRMDTVHFKSMFYLSLIMTEVAGLVVSYMENAVDEVFWKENTIWSKWVLNATGLQSSRDFYEIYSTRDDLLIEALVGAVS